MMNKAAGTVIKVNTAAKPSRVCCQFQCCRAQPSAGVMTAMPAIEPVERKNNAMPRRRLNQQLMTPVRATGLVKAAPTDMKTPKLQKMPAALRVFNMVLHMDEATPHLHVDFVPVATEQSRGLSTRVSMKQALKQQGFEGLGRKQTEWKAWMEREKEALTEIAQTHEFEIISLGGGRPHMELPEYRAAAQRLEAVQEQVIAAEQEIAALEKQRKALQGNVKLLKAVEKVKPDLDAIQPERTLTGAVKGVTVEQVKELKAAVIRGAAAEQKVRELKVENQQLQQKIPSMKEKLKEAQERQQLENENRQLKVQVEYLEKDLSWERGISARLQEGIGAVLDFLDRHLPEQFRPLVEKARELLPVPEVQQPEREQERGHTWGGMER